MGVDITPFDDDIAGGYITRGGNVPCNGDFVGGGPQAMQWQHQWGKTSWGERPKGEMPWKETKHWAMVMFWGRHPWGECHGWSSCDVRHCGTRWCNEQWHCCRSGGRGGEAVVALSNVMPWGRPRFTVTAVLPWFTVFTGNLPGWTQCMVIFWGGIFFSNFQNYRCGSLLRLDTTIESSKLQ